MLPTNAVEDVLRSCLKAMMNTAPPAASTIPPNRSHVKPSHPIAMATPAVKMGVELCHAAPITAFAVLTPMV